MFAYSGDGINGIVTAFGRADNHPTFIEVRHEQTAALAAVGYAKFSNRDRARRRSMSPTSRVSRAVPPSPATRPVTLAWSGMSPSPEAPAVTVE